MKKFLTIITIILALLCMGITASAANTEVESNNISGRATVIKTGTTYTATTGNEEDIDWFKFTNNKNYFQFYFTPSTTNADAINDGWNITIFDSSSTKVLKEYPDVTEAFVTPKMPYSGYIYIKVVPQSISRYRAPMNCSYTVKANTMSSSTWESEYNNTPSTADSIKLSTTYTGVLNDQNDVDYFKFSTNYDYFCLVFNFSPNNNPGLVKDGWVVSILTDNGKTVLKDYSKQDSFTSVKLPYTGKFYIKVEPQNSTEYDAPIDCYYTIKVIGYTGKYEKENNNTAKNATQISTSTYSGVLNFGDDVDYYKFSSTNQHFKLSFGFNPDKTYSNEINDGWNITIYASNGKKVLAEYEDVSDSFTTKPIKGESTIYVCIRSQNDYYSCAPVDCYYTVKVTTTSHSYKDVVKKATLTKDGKITPTCQYCNAKKTATIIKKASKISLSKTSFKYNGKTQKPTVIVKDSDGKAIDSKNYSIKWSNSSSYKVGTYKVTITFKNNYSGTKTLTYKIVN